MTQNRLHWRGLWFVLLFWSLPALGFAAPATKKTKPSKDSTKKTEPKKNTKAKAPDDMAAIRAAMQADNRGDRQKRAASINLTPSSSSNAGASRNQMQAATAFINISLILDFAFAWFVQPDEGGAVDPHAGHDHGTDDSHSHGRVDNVLQTGAHDPKTQGFNLQNVELSLNGAIDPFFRLDTFLVFLKTGVELEEIYATTTALPGRLQLRIGQFLQRFGRINASHPHTWNYADQPIILGKMFGGEGLSGMGVEASWLTPLPWYVELVGSVTDPNGAKSFLNSEEKPLRLATDFMYMAGIKQFFAVSDNWSLSIGLHGLWGPLAAKDKNGKMNTTDFRTQIYNLAIYLKWRPITYASWMSVGITAEWFLRIRTLDLDNPLTDLGGYVDIFWQFARQWAVALRYEQGTGIDRSLDPTDSAWVGDRHKVSLAATFWPSEFSRIRLQGTMDVPLYEKGPTYAVFVAVEFLIGAHGAHRF